MNNKIERMENLAKDIYDWCIENELWGDNCIYFNGKAWASWADWHGEVGRKINDRLYEYDNKNPVVYFEYANPNTLSMSFEGVLNYVLNGYTAGCDKLINQFNKLFEKYGLWWEQGFAWTLSAYDDL